MITSYFFRLPTYDEAGKSTAIVMALMMLTLSTMFDDTQSK